MVCLSARQLQLFVPDLIGYQGHMLVWNVFSQPNGFNSCNQFSSGNAQNLKSIFYQKAMLATMCIFKN